MIYKILTRFTKCEHQGANALRTPESGPKETKTDVSTMKNKSLGNNNGENNKLPSTSKGREPENILLRFYKRYMTDNYEQDYDCDNFSKL